MRKEKVIRLLTNKGEDGGSRMELDDPTPTPPLGGEGLQVSINYLRFSAGLEGDA